MITKCNRHLRKEDEYNSGNIVIKDYKDKEVSLRESLPKSNQTKRVKFCIYLNYSKLRSHLGKKNILLNGYFFT